MLRIRTKIGSCQVYTYQYEDRWLTLWNYLDGTRSSLASDNLHDAGMAHLQIADKIRDEEHLKSKGLL